MHNPIQNPQPLVIDEMESIREKIEHHYPVDSSEYQAALKALELIQIQLTKQRTYKKFETQPQVKGDLLSLKALKTLISMQRIALPHALLSSPIQQDLLTVEHQLETEIKALEASGQRIGLDYLQQEAIAKYGEYGLLIEELRDAANGKLPAMFTQLGNLLARYRDLEPQYRDLEAWISTLESMKTEIQKEIDSQNQELYSRRGV